MAVIGPILVVTFLGWGVHIYNRLVRDKNRVLAAWSDIDVQLKRRHDLVPKLVEAVKQYARYEQATLTAVTELRVKSMQLASPKQIGRLETDLGIKLRQLVAIAESYPELQASRSFLSLQKSLTEVENHIQYARRYYNGAVRNLNVRIESFPDMALARLFRFRPREYFELDSEGERLVAQVV